MELLENCGYSSYPEAIRELVPEEWREKWIEIMDGRTSRPDLAQSGPKEILRLLRRARGFKRLKKALVKEAAVDNHVWRAAFLSAKVDPETTSDVWKRIAKDWQDELVLLLRTRQDVWHAARYDDKDRVRQAYDHAVQQIRTTTERRAQMMRHERFAQILKGDQGVVIWKPHTIEDQASSFTRIVEKYEPFQEITPVMYRQLKARLYFRTRYMYNAPTRNAIRAFECRDKDQQVRRRCMSAADSVRALGRLKSTAAEIEQTTDEWTRQQAPFPRGEEAQPSGSEAVDTRSQPKCSGAEVTQTQPQSSDGEQPQGYKQRTTHSASGNTGVIKTAWENGDGCVYREQSQGARTDREYQG